MAALATALAESVIAGVSAVLTALAIVALVATHQVVEFLVATVVVIPRAVQAVDRPASDAVVLAVEAVAAEA